MTNGVSVRELVLDILLEVNEKEQYSHLVIRDVLNKYQYLEKQERAFLTRLAEGTIEHMLEMDFIINSFSKVKVNKMKPLIRNLLRMSVYQLKYMDSIPDAAVCNEAVKLAKKRGFGQLRGFVNGVLRNISRGLATLTYPDENSFNAAQESQFLKEKAESEREIELLAIVDSVIAGTAGIEAIGTKYKVRHRAEFGISVVRKYWGLGIGKALLTSCIECAKTAGYNQLELKVVAENERAVSMYERAGFVECGRNPKGFRFSYY